MARLSKLTIGVLYIFPPHHSMARLLKKLQWHVSKATMAAQCIPIPTA